MDEAKAVAERDRAHAAARLLEDPLMVEAVQACNDKLWREFAESPISDDETRRNARIGLDMLNRIVANLRKHIESGKLADKYLADLEKERLRLGKYEIHRRIA